MEQSLLILNLLDKSNKIFEIYNEIDYKFLENNIIQLFEINLEQLIFAIEVRETPVLDSTKIPMFSQLDDCTINITLVLDALNNIGVTTIELGEMLLGYKAKDMALYKYGETHSKAAAILGLVKNISTDDGIKSYLTNIGYFFMSKVDYRNKLLVLLLLRSDIIKYLVKNSVGKEYYSVKDCLSFLSESTIKRRMPNIKRFIQELKNYDEYDFSKFINKLDFNYNKGNNNEF